MITINETEYLNICEYELHYMKMVHTMAPRANFTLTSPSQNVIHNHLQNCPNFRDLSPLAGCHK